MVRYLKALGYLILAAILLGLPWLVPSYYLHLAILSGINALLVLGLNLIVGYSGQISVGHAGFWGVGAYAAAILATRFGFPFWADTLIAGVVAALFGVMIGLPTIRLRGFYLVMTTIAFASIVNVVAGNWVDLTRGRMGIRGIPPAEIPIVGYQFADKESFFYLLLIITAFLTVLFSLLVRSKTGRALAAVREDEIAARAVGINVLFYKTLAFTVGAFLAGIAGSLYAHYVGYISPDNFTIWQSMSILAMVIVGGMGSVAGSFIGAIVLTYLPELLRGVGDLRMFVYGGALLVIVYFVPTGFCGLIRSIVSTLSKRGTAADAEGPVGKEGLVIERTEG